MVEQRHIPFTQQQWGPEYAQAWKRTREYRRMLITALAKLHDGELPFRALSLVDF